MYVSKPWTEKKITCGQKIYSVRVLTTWVGSSNIAWFFMKTTTLAILWLVFWCYCDLYACYAWGCITVHTTHIPQTSSASTLGERITRRIWPRSHLYSSAVHLWSECPRLILIPSVNAAWASSSSADTGLSFCTLNGTKHIALHSSYSNMSLLMLRHHITQPG